jgi:hypothetical protein
MMHYPMAIILPPKIYYYEPKIHGFKVAGKRGSTTFNPVKGNVRYIVDSMQSLELEALLDSMTIEPPKQEEKRDTGKHAK